MNDAIDSAADVSPWISVRDRLPDDPDNMVLVSATGKPKPNIELIGAVELALYNAEEGWIIEEYPEWENAVITYWMPIPELPKGDKT
mgnify:CR=1 FL=1